MYQLGILGGMGPFATADTLARLVKFTWARTDQAHIPTLALSDPRVPDRSDYLCGKGEDPMPHLRQGLKTLETAGALAIIIPCNTAHHFVPQLQAETNIPILHMVEHTVAYVMDALQPSKVVVLGTSGLVQSGLYQNLFAKRGLMVETLLAEEQQAVMAVIREIKETGEYQHSKPAFEALLHKASQARDCCFVFACTELSLIKKHYAGLQVVDALDVLVLRAIHHLGYPLDTAMLQADDNLFLGRLTSYFAKPVQRSGG